MVEKLRRQMENSKKLLHKLKRQLQLDHGHARQDAPARGFSHNVYANKRSSNNSRKSFVDSAAVSSTLMIDVSLDGRVVTHVFQFCSDFSYMLVLT